MPKTAEDLKTEAKQALGEQTYETATKMSVLELNRAYSTAHQQFDDRTAQAYKNLLLVRMMGGK